MKIIISLTLFFLAITAYANSKPQSVVESIVQNASKQNLASDDKLQKMISHQVDFESMAYAALGDVKKNLKASELKWFSQTLQEIITRSVYPEAPNFLQNVKIRYKRVKEKGNKATVKSSVRQKGEVTDVNYDLVKTKQEWRVVDVSIDGESWVEDIQEQVERSYAKGKWSGLKSKLQRKLNSLKKTKRKRTAKQKSEKVQKKSKKSSELSS